jgi:hypothetical protein
MSARLWRREPGLGDHQGMTSSTVRVRLRWASGTLTEVSERIEAGVTTLERRDPDGRSRSFRDSGEIDEESCAIFVEETHEAKVGDVPLAVESSTAAH